MPSNDLPREARVVVVGGGVIGCAIAYHLARIGWSDCVLLERRQLTCGTTWHAAGLIGQLRDNQTMFQLARYTAELYRGLEAETGQAIGYKINGSLSLATHAGRMEDLQRRADMAKVFGLQVDVIGPEDCRARYPLIQVDDVVGGLFIPSDGQADPVGVTQALAKGARQGGVAVFEDTPVTNILVEDGRTVGVRTPRGDMRATHVVLACGMWARELAATVGVGVPLHACEHFYIVTEPFDAVAPSLPVLRDYDNRAYYKEDAGKILLGAFELKAKPWGMDGIPENFCFDQLPDDFDHFQPVLEAAMRRMPALETAGIQTFFCGPESFTPDNRYHLGPVPGLDGLFIAAGLNSIGIQSAGGIGKVVSEWLRDGLPPANLTGVDIRRNMPFQSNAMYLRERVSETLGLLYDVHWPFYQYRTARGVRRSPLHERLAAAGACFGETAGWERANWFAEEGQAPVYEYRFGRQNWFENSAAEHAAVRESVGLLDLSPFAKFRVSGPDAEAVLNQICANDVAVPVGRVVYTQWLNPRGGIEADLTVTRIGENDYMVVTSAASQTRDFYWLRIHIPDDARVAAVDVTSAEAVIAVMGPRSRAVLSDVTTADLAPEAFPFATAQDIEVGYAPVRAARVSYVGELGWELYVPAEFAVHVYDTVMAAGNVAGLRPVGMHAMESLRLEKAFRHWGHDISDEDTPLEAGLGFAVAWDKPGGFIGGDALLRQREVGVGRRLLQFRLEDPEPLLYHNEPVWRDGAIAGYLTSGWYGHTLGGGVGLGYVDIPAGSDAKAVANADYEVEVAGIRHRARASLRPLYDPKNTRMRG